MMRKWVVKRLSTSSSFDRNYHREVNDEDVFALETALGSIEHTRTSLIFFLFVMLFSNTVMGSDRQSLPIILAPEAELNNQLNSPETRVSGVTDQSYSQNDDRRVHQNKLEELYKKGLISKEVFDERSSPKALTFEQRLEKLKGLREKGLISKEVYESRQKELLDENL